MSDKDMPANGGNCNLTLVEHEGEPRVRDVVLGRKLGMKRPTNIRALIERHKDALAKFGPCTTLVHAHPTVPGRETVEYLLNEEQAVYLVTQSDAPNALETKVMVVKVFVAWRHGHLAPTAEASELTRRTDGIARMLAHKVTGIEQEVGQIGAAVIELAQHVKGLLLAADPRVAALEYVSVRELLNEAHALQKGRNSINRKIGRELRDRALLARPPLAVRKCPHSGVWLFPRDFSAAYMAERGDALVAAHNDRVMGQGVLKFPDRRRKPTNPNNGGEVRP